MRGERPTWDVLGHMVLCCDGGGDQMEFRVRTYPSGCGCVDVDGVTHPIPPTMTAVQYLEMVFSHRMSPPGMRATGSGD